MAPDTSIASPTLMTVPEIEEKIFAETKPPASAIIVPTFTLSPSFTMALAGAPICWLSGYTAILGNGACLVTESLLSLFSSGCIPPILKVFDLIVFVILFRLLCLSVAGEM